MEEIRSIIRKKYAMDRQLAAIRLEVKHLEEVLPQKTWALREANVALVEYESGVRAFFHKFSGKFDDKREALARQVREAQADRDYWESQCKTAKASLQELEDEAAKLSTRDALFAQYPQDPYLHQQDALLCAEQILQLLQQNEGFLQEARDLAENRNAEFRGHPYGVAYDKDIALSRAADCARQIFLILSQINDLNFGLEIHGYFQNPDGFIAGAARQFGQLDRINYALRGLRQTRAIMLELQQQLEA